MVLTLLTLWRSNTNGINFVNSVNVQTPMVLTLLTLWRSNTNGINFDDWAMFSQQW